MSMNVYSVSTEGLCSFDLSKCSVPQFPQLSNRIKLAQPTSQIVTITESQGERICGNILKL